MVLLWCCLERNKDLGLWVVAQDKETTKVTSEFTTLSIFFSGFNNQAFSLKWGLRWVHHNGRNLKGCMDEVVKVETPTKEEESDVSMESWPLIG